eukprot:SAG11_NODE_29_length_23137_cov_16.739995_17_plen_289_part_00
MHDDVRSFLVDLTEIILFENYCSFANRFWKAREIAEIYLHMLERDLWARFNTRMLYGKRYVDDGFVVFRCPLADVERFAAEYGANVMALPIEHDIDRKSFVLLDTHASKSDVWTRTGKLDLNVHQKNFNAYLYIPEFCAHPAHILRAFIKGELIRYIKRCNTERNFTIVRELFRQRLLSRGYNHGFLRTPFSTTLYKDRWNYLYRTKRSPPNASSHAPAVLALTLPHTPRARELNPQRALFLASERSPAKNYTVDQSIREATFRVAWRMERELGAFLIQYRYPREPRT